jgi:tetratricopeptide (TPR) repeat protein
MLRRQLLAGVSALLLLTPLACGGFKERPRFAYSPAQFRDEVVRRVPEFESQAIEVPFEVDGEHIKLALETIRAAPLGHARIEALVRMLHVPPPEGLGLRYAATTTQTAEETIRSGKGNCVALASVLVGLGRGIGWPVFYAEALVRDEEIRREDNLAIRADHMVVVITAKTVKAVVDFTGPVEGYTPRIIDDLHAYAHLVNNRASEVILANLDAGTEPAWGSALDGFTLATRITPDLARAWNNRGVALARLGRLEDARGAYAKALSMQGDLDSPQQNLIVLETRSRGETTISKQPQNP